MVVNIFVHIHVYTILLKQRMHVIQHNIISLNIKYCGDRSESVSRQSQTENNIYLLSLMKWVKRTKLNKNNCTSKAPKICMRNVLKLIFGENIVTRTRF